MNDTHPDIEAKMIEMIQKRLPEERLTMGCSMYDFSRELIVSAILREKPGLSENELRKEIFLKFYSQDFDDAAREKIANHLLQV